MHPHHSTLSPPPPGASAARHSPPRSPLTLLPACPWPPSAPQDWKPDAYKALKRKISQLLTVKRERELAAGVDRRASKSAERAKLIEAGLGRFAS